MALKSTNGGIVHRAPRTRAHSPTMVSSFTFSSDTVCLPRFCRTAAHISFVAELVIYREKFKTCEFLLDQWFSTTGPQSINQNESTMRLV